MMAFGTGSRVCGGQNFANIMLRILVATVARNFTISALTSETNERSMEMCDAFVSSLVWRTKRFLHYRRFCSQPRRSAS